MEHLRGTAASRPRAAQLAIDLGSDPELSDPPVAEESAAGGYAAWSTEEIVRLHFVLLDDLRRLAEAGDAARGALRAARVGLHGARARARPFSFRSVRAAGLAHVRSGWRARGAAAADASPGCAMRLRASRPGSASGSCATRSGRRRSCTATRSGSTRSCCGRRGSRISSALRRGTPRCAEACACPGLIPVRARARPRSRPGSRFTWSGGVLAHGARGDFARARCRELFPTKPLRGVHPARGTDRAAFTQGDTA